MEDEIDVKSIRKDGKQSNKGLAHGGIAVFFDSTKCSLRKFPPISEARAKANSPWVIIAGNWMLCYQA